MNGEHSNAPAPLATDRITFRCKYPDNCNCCPPNQEAFIALREDAERMQREHAEDMQRMEHATETILRLSSELVAANQHVKILTDQRDTGDEPKFGSAPTEGLSQKQQVKCSIEKTCLEFPRCQCGTSSPVGLLETI